MIGSSKNNRETYPRKCFWTQEKETRVKSNPGLSANRPSNNWALDTSLSRGTHFRQEARFAGKAMDQCISDLFGDPRAGTKPCNITDECWRFIGRNNTQGYMTTHQALYLMVGEVKGELHYLKKVIFFACIFISNKHSFQISNATVKRCSGC